MPGALRLRKTEARIHCDRGYTRARHGRRSVVHKITGVTIFWSWWRGWRITAYANFACGRSSPGFPRWAPGEVIDCVGCRRVTPADEWVAPIASSLSHPGDTTISGSE